MPLITFELNCHLAECLQAIFTHMRGRASTWEKVQFPSWILSRGESLAQMFRWREGIYSWTRDDSWLPPQPLQLEKARRPDLIQEPDAENSEIFQKQSNDPLTQSRHCSNPSEFVPMPIHHHHFFQDRSHMNSNISFHGIRIRNQSAYRL